MMNNLKNGLSVLDDLDRMLVQELEKDARVSFMALAAKLGVSHTTIGRRFNRLVSQRIISIAAIPTYAALGFRTILLLAVSTPPEAMNTLARELISINSIKHLYYTAGRYEMMAIALYRSPEEYMTSFPGEFGNIPKNVRMDTMLSVGLAKTQWSHLLDTGGAPHVDVKITELDQSVLKGLEKFPRVPINDLARDIGASRSAIRLSLRKLTSQGIVRVVSTLDPTALGYNVTGISLIQVHPSSLKTLTNKLKVHPSVNQIVLTLGEFNCMVWTSFQNSEQLSDFFVHDLGNLPGVVHFDNLIYLKHLKKSFSLMKESSGGP